MPERFSFGPIELVAKTGSQPVRGPARADSDTPFKMLVLANFRGQGNSPRTGDFPRPVRVDLDNQESIQERLNPQVSLPFDGPESPALTLEFKSLEEFHPDAIVSKVPWFRTVLELRGQLNHPNTFSRAAAQLAPWIGQSPAPATPTPQSSSSPAPSPAASGSSSNAGSGNAQGESTGDMLERLLGRPGQANAPAQAPTAGVDIQALIQDAVKGSVVPADDPRKAGFAAAVDAVLAGRMNSILHHPDFQALESAWRGVDWLIKNLELDESLQLFLLDLDLDTLRQDASSSADVKASGFYKAVIQSANATPGGHPWALWMGHYVFSHRREDAEFLAGMGRLAHAAGTPFLAAMDPRMMELCLGTEPPAEEVLKDWNALRRMPEAASLGLALPGWLLRMPYGKRTDPVEAFDYEEMPDRPEIRRCLRAHPALGLMGLMGRAYLESGWDLSSALGQEVEELPAVHYKEDGESKMLPCAGQWLNDRQADTLIAQGLIPVQSIQGRNAVRYARIQSIQDPPAPLQGRWR